MLPAKSISSPTPQTNHGAAMARAYAQLPKPVQELAIHYDLEEKLLWSPNILRNRALVAFLVAPAPYIFMRYGSQFALNALWDVTGKPGLLRPGSSFHDIVMNVISGASFMVVCAACMKMANDCTKLGMLQSYGITPTVFTDPAIADFRRDCGKLWRASKTLPRVTLGHVLRDRQLLGR